MIEYRNFQIEKFEISKISSFNSKNYPTSPREEFVSTNFKISNSLSTSDFSAYVEKKSLSLRSHFPIIILSFDLIHEFFQREKKISSMNLLPCKLRETATTVVVLQKPQNLSV